MKKIIITIFITLNFIIIAGLYAVGILYSMVEEGEPGFLIPLGVGILAIVLISIIGILIYTMYDRIKEIRGGNENDISKY